MSKYLLKWPRDSRASFSEQRILLINTPLQNTLKELWTMIHFLLPGITRPYSDFPVKAGTDQNQDYCHKLVIRLHRVSIAPSHYSAFKPFWFHSHAVYTNTIFFTSVDDPAVHLEALQTRCRETASKEVWTHPEVPSVQQTEKSLWGYPHSARVKIINNLSF